MTATPHLSITTQATSCKICHESIPPKVRVGNLETNVCDSMECRSVVSAEKSMSPANYALFLSQQSALIQKKKRLVREEKERIAAADEEESRADALLVAKLQESRSELSQKHIPTVSIPSGKSTLAPIGQERLSRYREHLVEVIAEAFQDPPITDYLQQEDIKKAALVEAKLEANPQLANLTSASCGLCKGGCCSAGNDSGLISLETIKRAVKIYKFTNEEEVLNSYLSLLGDQSVEHSCINHGPKGCVLPKRMRSDVCNGYYCESLKELLPSDLTEPAQDIPRALIVQRGYDRWSKYDERTEREIESCTYYEGNSLTDIPLPK